MSFSSEVKKELAGILPEHRHCLEAALRAFSVAFDNADTSSFTDRTCCKKAYLRAAFLSMGSLSDPSKSYLLEFLCPGKEEGEHVKALLRSFGIRGKTVERKTYYVVYLKDGDQIADFLALVGATGALLSFENTRVLKDVRNSVNRKVNCETANLNKTVSAGLRDVRDIEWISENIGLETLPEPLREMANIRLSHPDATLTELGNLFSPPVTKSGVNHRLRRLKEIAEEGRL